MDGQEKKKITDRVSCRDLHEEKLVIGWDFPLLILTEKRSSIHHVHDTLSDPHLASEEQLVDRILLCWDICIPFKRKWRDISISFRENLFQVRFPPTEFGMSQTPPQNRPKNTQISSEEIITGSRGGIKTSLQAGHTIVNLPPESCTPPVIGVADVSRPYYVYIFILFILCHRMEGCRNLYIRVW
jgi:hypothetical protein